MDQQQSSQHEPDSSYPEQTNRDVRGSENSPSHLEPFSLAPKAPAIQYTAGSDTQPGKQLVTGQTSNDIGITRVHDLGIDQIIDNPADKSWPPHVQIQPVVPTGVITQSKQEDLRHVASTTEPQLASMLLITSTVQDHGKAQTAPAFPTVSLADPVLSQSSFAERSQKEIPKEAPKDIPTTESRTTYYNDTRCPDQYAQPRETDIHGQEDERGVSVSQGRYRLGSILSAPLTHPNGVEIFPHLSTPEQELLAQEALTQAEESIVADNMTGSDLRDDGSDGGYDSEGFSSGSTSAESSVRDYIYENGRRYHRFREGTYNFPNDDVEQEREDMKHAMVKLLCSQKLHFAPIGNNPQEMLDLGTGTGIWAIEMGDQFPSAHILGIDLSPIQPDWLPPNVRFMVDDMESPWLHPRNHFDYIHTRHTVMAIKQWDRLFRRAFEHMKPGGWIEMQEIHHRPRSANMEGAVDPEHPVAKFWTLVTEGLAALGVNFDVSSGGILAAKMREAGFTNVTERVFHVPIGTWPKNKVLKTVGLYWRTILLDGLQAIALGPLTRGLRWNRDQVELFLMDVRRAYHDNSALMYMPLHILYAQKPTTAY